MALRWFLVGTQYRQPVSYSQSALEEASGRIYYIYETLSASRKMIHEAGTPHLRQLR
jgi:cysteinyl-tRNA synthetase